MLITLTPVAGDMVVALRVEDLQMSVNGTTYDLGALPTTGSVRLQDGAAVVDYGELGGVNTCQTSFAHVVRIVPPALPPAPPPAEASAAPDPATLRGAMVCERWQMILALGEARWAEVLAFAQGAMAPWSMTMIIENAQIIPRLSETVDTLAWVLQLEDDEVDALFLTAMAIGA